MNVPGRYWKLASPTGSLPNLVRLVAAPAIVIIAVALNILAAISALVLPALTGLWGVAWGVTLIALIATACGGGQAAAPSGPVAPTNPPAQPAKSTTGGTDTLAGTSWTLATLKGQPALAATAVTLNFVAGKVAGSDGCNNYSGSYTADGTNIKFSSSMAATMKACPDPIMKQAAAYMQALGQAATYKADAQQLTLLDSSGKELAMFNAQSSDLGGTSWIVSGYNNGKQAVVSVMTGTELTANFGADGKLTGSAGCNNYTAGYQTDGSKISIGPAATTRPGASWRGAARWACCASGSRATRRTAPSCRRSSSRSRWPRSRSGGGGSSRPPRSRSRSASRC